MIRQRDIQGAWLRAAYFEAVDPARPVAWFGAGAFARTLAGALQIDRIASVSAIYDDHPDPSHPAIAGIPVCAPENHRPPNQVVLATDTHAHAFRGRIGALWGANVEVIDLLELGAGCWIGSGEDEAGFARTHPERWREAIGLAQLTAERTGEHASPGDRWRLAHSMLRECSACAALTKGDPESLHESLRSLPLGGAVMVESEAPLNETPGWREALSRFHGAVSPDGRHAVVVNAARSEFPAAPLRVGSALWIPQDSSDIVGSLYGQGGSGAKQYTVRFDSGREFTVIATRERTYADLRARAELVRYERFLCELKPGMRVLDCATGTGPGAALLASRGLRVSGVDVDPGAIEFATERYEGIDFRCASAADLPFESGAFDAVISVETVEHLPDPACAIREFARVLKPEGSLCLTTPDEGGCDSPFHEVELTVAQLDAALDDAFGESAWAADRVEGEPGWHAMVVRRRRTARLTA